MDHIARILPTVLQRRGLAAHAGAALSVYRAKQWIAGHMGPLGASVHVRALKDGTLLIECDHPIAAQECQAVLPMLLRHLCEQSGPAVREIRIMRSKSVDAQKSIE